MEGFRTIDGQRYRLIPFFYTAAQNGTAGIATTAVVGASATGDFQIDSGAPFLCHSIHLEATQDTATLTTLYQFLVQIIDGDSNRVFANYPVPRTVYGSKEFPLMLPSETILRPATKITATITNLAAAPSAGTVYVTLRGYRMIQVQR